MMKQTKRDVWIAQLRVSLFIALKDARIYFFKGPNLTFGLFLPLVLYGAYVMDRDVAPQLVLPGLVAVALLFGAGAIQGVALPLERRTGTLDRLLAAPVTPSALVLSKALAGAAFGVTLALLYAPALYVIGIDGIRWGPYLLVAMVSAFCFSLFGLLLALPFRDIPQAMPPATVVRILLVFISGAFSAPGGAETIWRRIAYSMPLVYAVDGFRHAIRGTPFLHSFGLDLLGLAGLASLYAAIAVLSFKRQRG